MTCIVGAVGNGEVWLGGDGAITAGDSIIRRKEPKVFRRPFTPVGAMLIGCSGSARVLQLAQYVLRLPPLKPGSLPMDYLVCDFVPAWRACLKENGAMSARDNCDEMEARSTLLLAFRGGLFCVDCDFNIYESEVGFLTIGTGCEVADGAMHATKNMLPEARIKHALEAAADLIWSVSAPFHIEKL